MSAFRKAMGWLALRASKLAGMPLRDPSVSTLFGYMDTTTGVSVTEWTAMNYSCVWAAAKIYGEAVGQLPVCVGRDRGAAGFEEMPDHPLAYFLNCEWNAENTAMVARETAQVHSVTWGNSYSEVERDGGGRVAAIWPLTPNRVMPDRDSSGALYYIVRKPSGGADTVDAADMLHVPGMSFDGVMGYSVVTMAREAIGMGLATERYGASFFGNGTMPCGILSTEQTLKPEARENTRDSWNLMHQGVDRAHRVGVLDHGLKWQTLVTSPEDAQFLQTRKFNVLDMARWFNLPPHMLRDLERATHSNVEQQALEFVVYSLTPWLRRWEQEYERKLLTPAERRSGIRIRHDVSPLLMTDIATRFDAYAKARQWGWLSANDVRRREHLNPVPQGCDMYMVPVNMADASLVTTGGAPAGAPSAPPPPPAKKTPNPTDPVQPLIGRSEARGRTVKTALDLLAALRPEGDELPVCFPSVAEAPFKWEPGDFADAEVETLVLSDLVSLRPEVKRGRLEQFVRDAASAPTGGDMGDLPEDRPYVGEFDGVYYIVDGTHRAMALQLLGVQSVNVYCKDFSDED